MDDIAVFDVVLYCGVLSENERDRGFHRNIMQYLVEEKMGKVLSKMMVSIKRMLKKQNKTKQRER